MAPLTADYTTAQMTDSELKRALADVNMKIAAATGAAVKPLEELRREFVDEQDDRRRIRSARPSDETV